MSRKQKSHTYNPQHNQVKQAQQAADRLMKELCLGLIEIQKDDYSGRSVDDNEFSIAITGKIRLKEELCKEIKVETLELGDYWKNIIPKESRKALAEAFRQAFESMHNQFSQVQHEALMKSGGKNSALEIAVNRIVKEEEAA